jgi:carboxyl-terminal processing protease
MMSAFLISSRRSPAPDAHQGLRANVIYCHIKVRETYGYIRISQFEERTEADLENALGILQQAGMLHGIVLDLRNNPGGLFLQAVKIADVFLDEGLIVRTESRLQSQSQSYYARREGTLRDIPMAVLVNRGSAAGSEIVAAALQAHKRALLVGTPTFGRGTIQTILLIGDQAALRLTTARAYSPTGALIDLGLQPDVLIDTEPANGLPSTQDAVAAAALQLLSRSDVQ